VAFIPNSASLATASDDETVKLWDLLKGREIDSFRGHVDRVLSVAFVPGRHELVSSGVDGTVRLWNIAPPSTGSHPEDR
jgi:WD40 repeat protein